MKTVSTFKASKKIRRTSTLQKLKAKILKLKDENSRLALDYEFVRYVSLPYT